MDGELSFVEHDCMDAGGRTTQETKSRDANQNDPVTELIPHHLQDRFNEASVMIGNPQGKLTRGGISLLTFLLLLTRK
jgi:hypothetical protein